MRPRRLAQCGMALATAAAALLMGVAPMAQAIQTRDGGGGVSGGGPIDGTPFVQKWAYRDNGDGGYGGYSLDGVRAALKDMGMTLPDGGKATAQAALNQADTNCSSRFDLNHPEQKGHAQCRIVSVGAVTGTNMAMYGDATASHDIWMTNWTGLTKGKTFSHNGASYTTSEAFYDNPSNTVNKIADRYAGDAGTGSIVVVMLDQYEPVPADVAPAQPSKSVQKGVSADAMVNHTTIGTGTGVNGKHMTMRDTFHPNGQKYTVSNQRVTDITTGEDLTSKFTSNTPDGSTPPGGVATMTWNGGDLPKDHTWHWDLDVTVCDPTVSTVDDTGGVHWKGSSKEVDQDTPDRRFPTWRPAPDKSWVRRDAATDRWQAVIDPTRSNATGADGMKFLDGDEVAGVVNGTVDAHLVQAPRTFALTDDWSKASYLVKPQDASKIRVYEADGTVGPDGHYTLPSVDDITDAGRDVTAMFAVTIKGSRATATARPAWLARLKGMAQGLQVTMLVPFTVSMAHGGGAAQARTDHKAKPGDELTFCDSASTGGHALTNAGSEQVNGQATATNEPRICGYVPPVEKDVVGEASQGGDQASVDGRVVFPGQKVEYRLDTQPSLPADLAYTPVLLSVTDTYSQWLDVDKQTLEATDLTTGRTIPKSVYTTTWDRDSHSVRLVFSDRYVHDNWAPGSHPRLLVRFEGTVSKDAPRDTRIGNRWGLALDNSLTPSNEVYNLPPDLKPGKTVTQSKTGIDVDGRTFLKGDRGEYHLTLDASGLKDTAYRVQRLGMVDDYEEPYLAVDAKGVTVHDKASGEDVTGGFDIQVRDGVAYVFARTVDTPVPATGETIKGDPQPDDLKAYSTKNLDPLRDPCIDQGLLGRSFDVTLPFTVTKADGHTVSNTATQVTNGRRETTNTVSNPVQPIQPSKDVVVAVGGDSVDGRSVWLHDRFLYQLDSSILPANRAYPDVDDWSITDQTNPQVDEYTGQWAVYATRDLYQGSRLVATKGQRIAGTGYDSSKLGPDGKPLFTVTVDDKGLATITATDAYRALVSADTGHEAGWRAYLQFERVKTTDRRENTFTEHYNGRENPSNLVWTRTPDMTPSLSIEKWDQASGKTKGDRDLPKDALDNARDGTTVVFTITNTSPDTDHHGAWFQARDLRLTDRLVAGEGEVTDLHYPADWGTLVLKPGQSVDVTGTLHGVKAGGHHTDRAAVDGTPLTACPADADPSGTQANATGDTTPQSEGATPATNPTATHRHTVSVEGRTLCQETKVASDPDDWNGKRPKPLATTGTTTTVILATAMLLTAGGTLTTAWRRRNTHPGNEEPEAA